MSVQRYRAHSDAWPEPDPDGDWVRVEDHQVAIAELEECLMDLRAELEDIKRPRRSW